MIKNTSILKTQKFQNNIWIFLLFITFSCTNNKYYDDKDIITILDLSITEFSSQNHGYLAIEFAPRLRREQTDKSYLKRFIESGIITQKDMIFMLNNNQYRFRENRLLLTDHISLNGLETIEANPYYKGEKYFFKDLKHKKFLRLSFPYISIDKNFAIIGYESRGDFVGGGGIIVFSKSKEQEWVISKKHQEWVG